MQANPLAPSLLDSQAMQGNPIIVAWLLLDWEGSDKKQLCQLRKIKCVHCRGVKPQDNPTTLSITTLVSTEITEEVNNGDICGQDSLICEETGQKE